MLNRPARFRNTFATALVNTYTATLIVALMLSFFSLFGCNIPTVDYSEYDGVDLIEGSGFDSGDWIADGNTYYVLFEAVSATVATNVGLPDGYAAGDPGTAIYRLEVLNLIPDGDFEDPTVTLLGATPAGWSVTGAPIAAITDLGNVNGNRELHIDATSQEAVIFDFTHATAGSADGLVAGAFYQLRFDFIPAETVDYQFNFDNGGLIKEFPIWESSVTDITIIYRFPFDFETVTAEFATTTAQNDFLVTDQSQELHIDDFRLVRTDTPLSLRIQLPYSDTGRLDLIEGWYTFSVYVRDDPTVDDDLYPNVYNRFAAQTVTVGIEEGLQLFDDSEAGVDWSGWTLLSFEIFKQIDPPDDPSEIVLELSITSADIVTANKLDSGSILITAPRLEFSPQSAAN